MCQKGLGVGARLTVTRKPGKALHIDADGGLLPQGKTSDAAFAALIGAADATAIEEDDEPISDSDSDAEA